MSLTNSTLPLSDTTEHNRQKNKKILNSQSRLSSVSLIEVDQGALVTAEYVDCAHLCQCGDRGVGGGDDSLLSYQLCHRQHTGTDW